MARTPTPGTKLAQLRRVRLHWTQERLAEALGVTPNTVARWERDEVPYPRYLLLAMEALLVRFEHR